jgi:cobalamin biosynthesis Co2+ chelatase CbiK
MWEIYGETEDGQTLYSKIDDDGLIRITAVEGYPELDEYLASLETPASLEAENN